MARNPYGSPNIFAAGMDAFDAGYDRMNTMRQDRAKMRAGRALASGDRTSAAQEFGQAGMTDDVRQMQADQQVMDDRETSARKDRAKQIVEFFDRAGTALLQIPDPDGSQRDRKAALQKLAPVIQQMVPDPEAQQQILSGDLSDSSLRAFVGEMKKYAQTYSVDGVGLVGVTPQGSVETLMKVPRKPDWKEVKRADGSTEFVDLSQQDAPAPSGGLQPQSGPAAPNTNAIFDALIQQESGGRAGVLGPQTRYGRAEGKTQMLPSTAQEMAGKLGVAWRPELMRGTTPEAAQYQETLGRAYFEEGLQKYGGDVQKALMYYHGGPDERLWGPKTRAYAQQVLGRAQEPVEIAVNMEGGPGRAGSGPRRVAGSAPQRPDAPAGYRWKPDGSLEPIPGGPQDKSAKANPAARAERSAKARNIISTVDNALSKIGRKGGPFGIDLPGSGEAGLRGAIMSKIPETKAYDLAADIRTIQANLGFEELQRMRDNSPTGGALGQVAVQELIALQATVANLDIGQSEAQLRANLQKVREHYNNWLRAVGEKPVGDAQPGNRGGKPDRPPLSSFQR